jgi:translation elongation factor EF-1alpha
MIVSFVLELHKSSYDLRQGIGIFEYIPIKKTEGGKIMLPSESAEMEQWYKGRTSISKMKTGQPPSEDSTRDRTHIFVSQRGMSLNSEFKFYHSREVQGNEK